MKEVIIYTDGACAGNPGPGGYGVVMLSGRHRRELSGGFRLTTNNRMEMMGIIVGLRALKAPCVVTVYSDSEYVVNSYTRRWVQKWKANGWKTAGRQPAKNVDLWMELLELTEKHKVQLKWVPGHAGVPENERCDELSVAASKLPDLPPDLGYERN